MIALQWEALIMYSCIPHSILFLLLQTNWGSVDLRFQTPNSIASLTWMRDIHSHSSNSHSLHPSYSPTLSPVLCHHPCQRLRPIPALEMEHGCQNLLLQLSLSNGNQQT